MEAVIAAVTREKEGRKRAEEMKPKAASERDETATRPPSPSALDPAALPRAIRRCRPERVRAPPSLAPSLSPSSVLDLAAALIDSFVKW